MKKPILKTTLFISLCISLFLFQNCSNNNIIEENSLSQDVKNNLELAYPNTLGEFIPINSNLLDGLNLEKINNEYILSGDIILTEKQKTDILKNRITYDKNSSNYNRTGLSNLSKRWTNCSVFYTISSELKNQSRVTDAIAHWESQYAIDFVLRTSETNYIEFVPSSGCSSFLGMVGGRQEIRLAPECSTGNVIHEIGHALGFLHEEQRTDRNSSIIINWNNNMYRCNVAARVNQVTANGSSYMSGDTNFITWQYTGNVPNVQNIVWWYRKTKKSGLTQSPFVISSGTIGNFFTVPDTYYSNDSYKTSDFEIYLEVWDTNGKKYTSQTFNITKKGKYKLVNPF